ncbi:MAG: hypothetical protein OEV42_07935 [Deltaproteobacteria bacterium]|nr:hypothetical protein [Deltaproteobacteria bacterium]
MTNTKDIGEQVLAYLLKNQDTGGALEDITNWWLEFERVDCAVDKVAHALEELIKQGKLKRVKGDRGFFIYKALKSV